MNFEASRAKALDKLNYFVDNNLSEYSKLRNFDFGPDKRNNVSCLSPYITHGVLNEIEIIKKSLKKFSGEKIYKTYQISFLRLDEKIINYFTIFFIFN